MGLLESDARFQVTFEILPWTVALGSGKMCNFPRFASPSPNWRLGCWVFMFQETANLPLQPLNNGNVDIGQAAGS